MSTHPNQPFQYMGLPEKATEIAPDDSEIRPLVKLKTASSAYCTLRVGKTGKAVYSKTYEEIWYVLSGKGEMWQKSGKVESIVELFTGVCLTVPAKNHFQFRNTGSETLHILLFTVPGWFGDSDVVEVDGYWKQVL